MDSSLDGIIEQALTKYPDFPKPGIVFRDISPVLSNPALFAQITQAFAEILGQTAPERIAGIESRGFIFASALAQATSKPLVLARKAGKLPGKVLDINYALEYGTATIEMQQHALAGCQSIAVVDDVIATGGTLLATVELLRRLDIQITSILALASIEFLGGRQKLEAEGLRVHALCHLK